VRLNTPLGVRVTRRAWVRGHVDPERVASAILGQDGVKFEGDAVKAFQKEYDVRVGKPQVVIMPTFNDLMGGLPVNSETPKSLLGPLFRSGAIEVDDFDVYLLDGTFLGLLDFAKIGLKFGNPVRPGRLTVTARGNIYLVDQENADILQLSFAGESY